VERLRSGIAVGRRQTRTKEARHHLHRIVRHIAAVVVAKAGAARWLSRRTPRASNSRGSNVDERRRPDNARSPAVETRGVDARGEQSRQAARSNIQTGSSSRRPLPPVRVQRKMMPSERLTASMMCCGGPRRRARLLVAHHVPLATRRERPVSASTTRHRTKALRGRRGEGRRESQVAPEAAKLVNRSGWEGRGYWAFWGRPQLRRMFASRAVAGQRQPPKNLRRNAH
jgi:hypothetical protein